MLAALEALPFIPTQQNIDSLRVFLETVQTATLASTASKARVIAKLQHSVQWVQRHLQAQDPTSALCQIASTTAGGTAKAAATAG